MSTDNTQLNPGVGGDIIRTLDRSGTGSPKTQVVQLDVGGADPGAEVLVSASNPLPTTVSNTVTITGSATISGTVTTSGTDNIAQFGGSNVVTGTGVSGVGIPRVTVSSDSFPATQPVSGTVAVSNFPATQPVSGTVTANQGGAPWTVKPDGTSWSQTGTSANVNVTNATLAVTQSGTWTVQQGTPPWSASQSGAWTVAATQSGTWTVQPGNTANTTAWLVTGTGGTFPTSPPANATTNVTQFGSTNVSTGTGAGGAGIPRVTVSSDSFPATQAVSVASLPLPANAAQETGGNLASQTFTNAQIVDLLREHSALLKALLVMLGNSYATDVPDFREFYSIEPIQ